jgi:hypothetical protein
MARVFVVADQHADVEKASPLAHVRYGGEYFFLYPDVLRLQAETGQLIDAQQDALFKGQALRSLRRFVEGARERTLGQPDEWSQRVGHTAAGDAIFQPTSRADVLKLLEALAAAAEEASSGGLGVWFVGD